MCCSYSDMADNHCIVEVRETSSLEIRVVQARLATVDNSKVVVVVFITQRRTR